MAARQVMLMKGNLRTNVFHEFGNFDFEVSTLVPLNTLQNLDLSFDLELSFKMHSVLTPN